MADMKREGTFNQKRRVSVGVFALTEADILGGAIVATLPARSIVTGVKTLVTTASGTLSSSITVNVGTTSIATGVDVTTTGVKTTATPGYFATGGDISVVAGATAPATGSLECEVVVEYIELDVKSGEYTN